MPLDDLLLVGDEVQGGTGLFVVPLTVARLALQVQVLNLVELASALLVLLEIVRVFFEHGHEVSVAQHQQLAEIDGLILLIRLLVGDERKKVDVLVALQDRGFVLLRILVGVLDLDGSFLDVGEETLSAVQL